MHLPTSATGMPQTLSATEVAAHNRPDDCWVVVHGVVYDVTSFLPSHPGGPMLLLPWAGADASVPFEETRHSQEARRRLSITLEARALQEEIRYDGLLVKLDTAETGMAQALAAALPTATPQDELPQTELRVVGQASRYKVGGEGEPELLKRTAFSMIKLEVDRSQLTPTNPVPIPNPTPDPHSHLNPNPTPQP